MNTQSHEKIESKTTKSTGQPKILTTKELWDFTSELDKYIHGKTTLTQENYEGLRSQYVYICQGLNDKFHREPDLRKSNQEKVNELKTKFNAVHEILQKGYLFGVRSLDTGVRITTKDKGQQIDTGETVYFSDLDRLHLSQGFTKDTMYTIAPLWYDKPVTDRKTGEILYTKKALGNFVISSKGEIIKVNDKFFQEKGIIAEFPETTLEIRWDPDSIQAFHNSRIDVNPKEVFEKLKGVWQHYMDLSGNPGAYTVLPIIDTLSYCIWLFQYAPYLKYEGEKGASKSKACQISEYLDFNAFSGVNFTPAVMFRTLQDTRGTLIIDEAETFDKVKNKSEVEIALESIINAGFKRNGKVSRMEKIDGKLTRLDFSVFGIKIIGGIHSVSETIRDRSYQIMLTKTLNKEIAKRTPRSTDSIFHEIRNMLYIMVLNHWQEIREIEQRGEIENRLGLIGREWDKAYPILVIAEFYSKYDPGNRTKIFNEVWAFLEDQKKREIVLTIDTFDEVVINAVDNAIRRKLLEEGKRENDSSEVVLELAYISKDIARLEGKEESKTFNLRNYSRSIRGKIEKLAIGQNFRHGTDNLTVFTSSQDLIKNARKRYSMSPSTEEKQESINSINSINPFNLINLINSINTTLKLNGINRNVNPENFDYFILNKENRESLINELNELIELIKIYRSNSEIKDPNSSSNEPDGSNKSSKNEEKQKLYNIEDAILETIKRDPKWKPGIPVDPSYISGNLLKYRSDILLSLKDLNEKILPLMVSDGVISISNGKVILTGKRLKDPRKEERHDPEPAKHIHYVLVTAIEDVKFASQDGNDYNLHKGDIVHIPEFDADLLTKQKRVRIISNQEENVQENTQITKEEGEQIVKSLIDQGIHLHGADTGISTYGDKYNVAVPGSFYRQNSSVIDQAMSNHGFTKGNTGSLGNVFFSRPLKGGDQK